MSRSRTWCEAVQIVLEPKMNRIVKTRLGADGKLRRVGATGKTGRFVQGRVNAARLDSPAAFAPGADTPVRL